MDPKEQLDELQMTPAGMLTLEQLLEVIMARVSNGIFVAFTEDDGFQMVSDDHSTGIEILGLLSMGESRLNAAVFDAPPEDEDDERGY